MVLFRRTSWVLLWLILFSTGVEADTFHNPGDYITAVLEEHPAVLKGLKLVRAAEFGVKGSTLQPNPS